MTDPHVGKLTYFRVYSGTAREGRPGPQRRPRTARSASAASSRCTPTTARTSTPSSPATSSPASASRTPRTGDTLCDPANPIVLEQLEFPEPVIHVAVEPKTKADQDKMGKALVLALRGGPDLPGPHRRGHRPDHHLRHGRAAPRGARRPHAARVQGRRQRRQAAGGLPRDHHPDRREGRPTRHKKQTGGSGQYADVDHHPRAHRPRRRLRVRRQDHRRPHPEGVHPRGRRRHPAGARRRRARRLPHGRHPGHPHRRQVPRRRLVRDGVQDRRLDGLQGGRPQGQAGPARADHGGRGRRPPRTTWATSSATSTPAAASRRHGAAGQQPGHPGPGAAGRDVRLRYRPSFAHPGSRHVHDAVRLVPADAASRCRKRSSPASAASSPPVTAPAVHDIPSARRQGAYRRRHGARRSSSGPSRM